MDEDNALRIRGGDIFFLLFLHVHKWPFFIGTANSLGWPKFDGPDFIRVVLKFIFETNFVYFWTAIILGYTIFVLI